MAGAPYALFLLLTMVFGGLSGVGIWFTMSVVNLGPRPC